MKQLNKVLCLILAVCFVGIALVACGDKGDTSAVLSDTGISGEASAPVEDENKFRLEKEDFGGVTIKILTNKATDYLSCEIAPTTLNNEPVNDAAYNRAALLSQEYGIVLEQVYAEHQGDVAAKAKAQAQSGLDEYQVFVAGVIYMASAALEDAFVDLANIEQNDYIDLSQPYWDQKLNDSISIKDRVYFATGDALVTDDESTWAIFFNKDIANDNQIAAPFGVESIYEIAEKGEWTIDVLYQMVKAATAQVGPDMTFASDTDDTWGMVAQCYDSYTFMVASDESLTRVENDVPIITIDNESNVRAYETVFNMLTDKQNIVIAEQAGVANCYDVMTQVFANGKALFMPNKVALVSDPTMREANIRYGILPMPKETKEQENYSSTVTVYWCSAMGIPRTNVDKFDATCYALEAMAYYGQELMTQEYYERTLKNKRFEDTESEEMLDLVFRNKSYDIGAVYSFSSILSFYTDILLSGSNSHMSTLETKRSAYELAIEDFLANLEG